MNDAQIDQAIDRAVRELLDVDPPAHLRARVIARIGRPAAVSSGWTIGAVAALAALAVVVIWVGRSRPAQPLIPAHTVAVRVVEPAAVPASNASRPPAAAAHVVARARVPRNTRVRAPRLPAAHLVVATNADDSDEPAVAPLDPPAPIRVGAVTQPDIAPQPLVLDPLAPIAEVRIAPLKPSDRRH